ncbi:NAD-specific glutamate dehydrogenase [compost metagenome]
MKLAKLDVVLHPAAFTLIHLNADMPLVVLYCIQVLHPADGDGGVPLNDGQEVAGLSIAVGHPLRHSRSEGIRAHIGEDQLLQCAVAGLQRRLDGCTQRHRLIRINGGVGHGAEHFPHCPADQIHPGGPADEDDAIQLLGRQVGVAQGPLYRLAQPQQKGLGNFLELAAVQPDLVLLPVQIKAHRCGMLTAKLQLAGFRLLVEGGIGLGVQSLRIQSTALDKMGGQQSGKILSAQKIISGNGLHLHDSLEQLQHRNVKGPSSQIKNEKLRLPVLLVDTVCQRRCRRFTDQAFHLETGNFRRLFGCLPLGVIKVCRHTDDRFGNWLPEISLGVAFQSAQHKGRQLDGSE